MARDFRGLFLLANWHNHIMVGFPVGFEAQCDSLCHRCFVVCDVCFVVAIAVRAPGLGDVTCFVMF